MTPTGAADPVSDDAHEVTPAGRLRGSPRLPGDKSISHRALLLALLARGASRIAAAGDGADVRSTAGICRALGATVERVADDGGRIDYLVRSPGAGALREPPATLDAGNSGTTTRLVLGLLAGQPLSATLDGDASLRRRPMGRVTEPLGAMGATFEGTDGATLLPLRITGRRPLAPLRLRPRCPARRSSRRSCWRVLPRTARRRSARPSPRATTRNGCSARAASP